MQTEMQTTLILIRLFLFRPALLAQKSCKEAAGYGVMINYRIYKTHINPQNPQNPLS